MTGNKRNFSLSIWDHKDNFLCLLKSANSDFKGQSFNENLIENINGEKTLTFSLPMYIFNNNGSGISNDKNNFIQNEAWLQIYNEQKIRYIEYDEDNNEKIKIQEFVLKNYIETRNGEEKIAECTCESLAVYELGKIGWNINFDVDYISSYELENGKEDLLTLDYWLKKIFYKESNLGRVSSTTECTYLLEGNQLRNSYGAPISNQHIEDENGNYIEQVIDEPIATDSELEQYRNNNGWTWSIEAKDVRDPSSVLSISTLYEKPIIDRYIEVIPNQYKPFNYQKNKNEQDDTKKLLPYPISEDNYGKLVYVTDIKKRLLKIERSNIYSIIQELCRIFEVFAYFEYYYDNSGIIIGREIKFKTESINEEVLFDFSYGKNLLSCQRSMDSNDLITKLIVPDTESTINEGSILSIKQATANPTNESYLYNFEYFYNNGMLSSGETDINSDEYKINLHCGKLKNYNTRIKNLQDCLVPLYNRQDNLNGQLSVQNASKIGIMDNMQAIQEKINSISKEQQEIQSWSNFTTQYNYVGELKTITTTTDTDGSLIYYLDFGREDILYNEPITIDAYTLNINKELIKTSSITTLQPYIPRCYNKSTYNPNSSTEILDSDFTKFIKEKNFLKSVVYSEIRGEKQKFIKGLKFNSLPINNQTFLRIRYKYAPLAWYYLLIKDYWEQLIEINEEINNLNFQLQEISNKILDKELILNSLLTEKNKEILQFEKKYKPFIREGYWEPDNYQGQISSKQLYTGSAANIFEGLIETNTYLKDSNLNESLNNYSYYINLGYAARDIDIDSISMVTKNPAIQNGDTVILRYRGNDYEIYLDNTNNHNIIIGIAPSLIDSYKIYGYSIDEYYKSDISFSTNGSVTTKTFDWIEIKGLNNPIIQERFIYLTNDNIITDSIKVYGGSNIDITNCLTTYVDYDYTFDYAGYTEDGIRVNLNEQESYSTDIYYDYIIKITLKNTNEVNKYDNFLVTYNEETTIQYLYQDAIQTSKKYGEPQTSYNIGVVDISDLKKYKNYKPILGQKVPIYDAEMGFNGFEGFITSISKILEKPESTEITIATYSNKFEDVFQKLTATMSDIQYNNNALYNAIDSFTEKGIIKTDVFQKSLEENTYQISLGTDNDVTIDKKSGILLTDKSNNSAVKLIGRGIFLTEDYQGDLESTWKTGITGAGINANTLVTGNIDTKNINIWNATEGQIRFMWNEEGLTAYGATGVTGTNTSTLQEFVDYNKYVRFNYDGLDFKDNTDGITRSALKLGWDGLQIQAQEGALTLDANNGLTLKDESNKTRLVLGRMNGNSEGSYKIYGLRLNNVSGSTTFQSDSNGNLWLAEKINIGGTFNNTLNLPNSPDAGVYGITTSITTEQMGPRRQDNGDMGWNSTPLRFWAGPRSYKEIIEEGKEEQSYLDIVVANIPKIATSFSTTKFPALSRFKVDSNGNIVASGIDVGGWIGAGKFLRSKDSEAILRSGGYENNTYPVLAIGKSPNSTSTDGTDYNFRVYQDGSINITNNSTTTNNIYYTGIKSPSNSTDVVFYTGTTSIPSEAQFRVQADGTVNATKLIIMQDQVSGLEDKFSNLYTDITSGKITIGNIGGFEHTSTQIDQKRPGLDKKSDNSYYVGMRAPSISTDLVFYAGTKGFDENRNPLTDNEFYVQANGAIKATNATITGNITANSGSIGNWKISQDNNKNLCSGEKANYIGLYPKTDSLSTSPVIFIGNSNNTTSNDTNTKFKVSSDGSVFFHGDIYGWSQIKSAFRPGINNAQINLYTSSNQTVAVEISRGLIIDIKK